MVVATILTGLSISETTDLLGFSQSLEFTQDGENNKKHPVIGSSVG